MSCNYRPRCSPLDPFVQPVPTELISGQRPDSRPLTAFFPSVSEVWIHKVGTLTDIAYVETAKPIVGQDVEKSKPFKMNNFDCIKGISKIYFNRN